MLTVGSMQLNEINHKSAAQLFQVSVVLMYVCCSRMLFRLHSFPSVPFPPRNGKWIGLGPRSVAVGVTLIYSSTVMLTHGRPMR
jgi:hypothetical protein